MKPMQARHSATQMRQRREAQADVNETRRRYYAALAAGNTPADAAAIAHGRSLAPRQNTQTQQKISTPVPAEHRIPADLSGLNWQEIRSLAIEQLGPDARSMKRAEIEAALTAKRADDA